MPSKKKKAAASAIVGEYDVELMTVQELRMYVKALEEELDRIRKARNLYSKDKVELLNMFKSTQAKIIREGGINMQQNVLTQEVKKEEEQESSLEDKANKVTKSEHSSKIERDLTESYTRIKMTEVLNKQIEDALVKDIEERDRQIDDLQFKFKLMSTQSTENRFQKFYESGICFKKKFEDFVTEYHKNFLNGRDEFSRSKMEELHAILGGIQTPENNPFADFIAKMTTYFQDIYFKNIVAIEKLQSILIDVETKLNIVTEHLHDVTNANKKLRNLIHDPSSPRSSFDMPPRSSPTKYKNIEELTYENHLLGLKLAMMDKEYHKLKENFISAFRRIHQAADFKALTLEEKLYTLQSTSETLH